MFRKTLKYLAIFAACILLLLVGFDLGFSAAEDGGLARYPHATPAQISSSTVDMSTFWQAWQLIDQKYLGAASVSNEKRIQGATAGLVQSLEDPYSEYFSPQDAQGFKQDVAGNFGGVGIQLGVQNDIITVIAPLKDTPAAAAGIKTGDQILMVDSTSTQGFSIEQAAAIIRGSVGTPVKLAIMRKGFDKPQDFTIVRQQISAPTLDFTMKEDGIAYIQLYQFNANADTLFESAIRKAALQGARGILLDLRGNPGGYLDVAIDLAGWFLPRGAVVVSQHGREGSDQVMHANGNTALAKVPTVVLIDSGSASAAEILAGTLRDNRHIPLVGDISFGKGTVQEMEDLPDGSLVKITIAHWVLPSGKVLEDGGLKPDYLVKLSDEDIRDRRDLQLNKGIEILRQEMAK